MNNVIRAENLVKRFRDVEALRGLDIEVPKNSVYALVGPNGAGKTTALKIMMNILRPTSGHAEVLGKASTTLAGGDFATIGYVSENQDLPDWMAVGDLLSYLRPFYPAWDQQLELALVQQLNLPLAHKLKALSRGARMKAALACSLSYRPKLIVLDEPFTGLDPLVRDELIQALLARSGDATMLISSHDLAEIESFATHVGYLEAGKLLFSEQLNLLRDRFREVEVILDTEASDRISWPANWLRIEVAGNSVRFVESNFDAALTPQQVQAQMHQVRELSFTPMSLRSIFVAIARSNEVRKTQEPL